MLGITPHTKHQRRAPGVRGNRPHLETTIGDAHKLDCEATENDCRFIIQTEDEAEAIELAREHMQDKHGKEYSAEELRETHLQTV